MRPIPSLSDAYALPTHGGDLVNAERRFGRPADGWLDLSTGINPFSYPLPELPPSCWRRLPDAVLEAEARSIAAEAYGASDPEQVTMIAGTQAIIQLLPRMRPISRVAVISPTYGEHAACWTAAGHQVMPCETLDRIGDAEVVVLVNPNNPDGRRHDPSRVLEIAEALSHRGGLMVVDEAFCDLSPELSLAAYAGPGLVILRSFGKFFGLGGVRLGFVIADLSLARLLRQVIGPWAVSGPALAIGRAALADKEWITAMRRRLSGEAAQLDHVLSRANLSVVGGTSLFRLVNASRAWALYEHLGRHGILVRPFAASPRWLRFGLPGGDDERQRLKDVLTAWVD
jgi:cobalamin biosynthetic protein CobC